MTQTQKDYSYDLFLVEDNIRKELELLMINQPEYLISEGTLFLSEDGNSKYGIVIKLDGDDLNIRSRFSNHLGSLDKHIKDFTLFDLYMFITFFHNTMGRNEDFKELIVKFYSFLMALIRKYKLEQDCTMYAHILAHKIP